LANLPTPLEDLSNFCKKLGGPRVLIKRDDQTGLAFGGNKARKLEFLMAEAMRKGADTVITTGAIQSNHARTTAAAARRLGMQSVLVLREIESEPRGYDGNLLLDFLMNADIRLVNPPVEKDPKARTNSMQRAMDKIAEELRANGKVPYIIPSGGSNPVGALGYVNAILELVQQANELGIGVTHIVHSSGGGGTQSGLTLGVSALNTGVKVLGISVSQDKNYLSEKIAGIIKGSCELLNLDLSLAEDDITVIDDYVSPGYGYLTQEVADTIRFVAETEGILLDPVYTGKAMYGMIDLIEKHYFSEDDIIVFFHTGGTPAIFPYKDQLRQFLES
jgi:D-cysteine desulfhydrase family pyridoxal phosphate-dependent enzyme